MKHDDPMTLLTAGVAVLGITLPAGSDAWVLALLERVAAEPQNLTAIDGLADGVARHLLDCLAAVTLAPVAAAGSIVDIGSGGGFPGLVLAAAVPTATVTLVESEQRKADFLRRASEDRTNVRVVADRSENLARREREVFDVATARAVAPLAATLELAAPLVAVGGHVIAWRGPADEDEAALAGVLDTLGLDHPRVTATHPFPGAQRRLLEFPKRRPTPERFPRRPGRATHRPLA